MVNGIEGDCAAPAALSVAALFAMLLWLKKTLHVVVGCVLVGVGGVMLVGPPVTEVPSQPPIRTEIRCPLYIKSALIPPLDGGLFHIKSISPFEAVQQP